MKAVLILMTLTLQAHASYNERAETLLHAKNPRHLRKDLKNIDQTDILKRSCELEIQEQKVPGDCYQFITLEKRKKKISKEAFEEKQQEYDEDCETAASEATEVISTKGLSHNCAQLVRERNKEVRYSKE